jgi:iron complex transport system ATP-binding protein
MELEAEFAVVGKELGLAYKEGFWVIKRLSFSIKKGSVFAILGPNGCGKTTLLKIILDLLQPQVGSIHKRGEMALVPQLFQVSFAFSALEMVVMGRAKKIGLFSQPGLKDRRLALEALERLNIADLAARPFPELSGGQRQLVMLARALVAEADILVLDEPASSLDFKNQALVLQWMKRLSRENGLTVVCTTHQPQHALAAADEALLMTGEEGGLVGRADEILSEANLKRLYGVDIKRLSFEHLGRVEEALTPVYLKLS